MVLNDKVYGCAKTRSSSSAYTIARHTSTSSEETAARIERIFKHNITLSGSTKTHLLAHISWFESYDQPSSVGKPVTVWYLNDTHTLGSFPFSLLFLGL